MVNSIPCYDYRDEVITHFIQWDVNQTITIKNLNIDNAPIFHFYNKNNIESIGVQSILKDGNITVDVPNILLESNLPINIFVYLITQSSGKSIYEFHIPVHSKKKPADYLYIDNIKELIVSGYTLDSIKQELNKSITNAENSLTLLNTENNKVQDLLNELNDKNITSIISSIISGYYGFEGYDDILGLQVDYENKRFTRLAGAVGLNAGADFDKFNMFGGRKRCNVKPDGTITAFYGDADYSDADVNVQAMVYQPAFYYKVVPIKMDKNTDGLGYHIRKANYYVSDVPKAGFKLHPAFYDENGNAVEYILFSAYEGVYFKDYLPNSSKARYITDALNTDTETNLEKDCILSYGDGKPISGLYKNITLSNAEKLCSNFGKGWHCETIKTLSANQMLMMIEFGMMNMQNAINKGIVNIEEVANANCAGNTGSTRNRGNATGTTAGTAFRFNSEIEPVTYTEDGQKSITYRGVENPWGNIWKMINGINVWGNGEMAGGEPYVADDFNFVTLKHSDNYKAVGFTVANGNGYINAMGYGKEEYDWLFLASQTGGNSALPVGDYFNAVSDLNGAKAATFGGRWTHNTMAGPFLFNFTDTGNSRTRNFGCRTVYVPTAE